MAEAQNPLLVPSFPFAFQRILPEHVGPGVRALLEAAEADLDALADGPTPRTWTNTLERLETIMSDVRHGTAPVQHLLTVAETPELRGAWREILPEISSFWSRLYLHEGVWNAVTDYADTDEGRRLAGIRRRHLERTLRDFRRAGADLSPDGRQRLEALEVELARLEQEFSENVLDATADFTLHVTDGDRLAGVPSDALARFRARARAEGKDGWILTLDHPSWEAVMKHALDRELRERLHRAYFERGTVEPWDNRPLIPRIVELRKEKARLLGYANFPDYRLEEQMARSGGKARGFVAEMVERTRPHWRRAFRELEVHARELDMDRLRPWDVSFVTESLRRKRFHLDDEELRPYFPLGSVLEGVFRISERLFGVRVEERPTQGAWHEDVRFFHLYGADGVLLGGFYTDLFPRREKRQGAWLNDFRYGGPRGEEGFEPHIAIICANFPPPAEDTPALLTHRDVETLFHEFGHLLHHMTSRVPIPSRGGVSVAWDWVEVPSQLLQNWCWKREALDEFARHWRTGEPLPEPLFEALVRARPFLGGWRQMRQLRLGALDLALHTEYDATDNGDPVSWVTENVLLPLSPNREFAEAHPLPSFLHLFSGGYAASYYSYLWSEVLEADLFTRFEERGIFHPETGRTLLDTILSAGDEEDPEVLFRRFMGRDPDAEALIRRNLGDPAKAPSGR
jgi:oligopeptidase A